MRFDGSLSNGAGVKIRFRWRLGTVILGVILSLLALSLMGCQGLPTTALLVGDARLEPGGTGTVYLSLLNPPDAKSLQIGPAGAFTFDPAVVRVVSVTGVNGFIVFLAVVDNVAGTVQVLAGFPGGSVHPIESDLWGLRVGEVPLISVELQAVGAPGSTSALDVTAVDLLADRQDQPLVISAIQSGRAVITGP